jgi:hypothetical protein
MDKIRIAIRKEILKELDQRCIKFNGAMEIIDFLDSIFDLKKSESKFFYDNAYQELKTEIESRGLDEKKIFNDPRINLYNCADDLFLKFLSQTLHPKVRNDAKENAELSEIYNYQLRFFDCACEIDEMGKIHHILYKYADFDTGLKILKSGKIKFSAPTDFNDLFDCQFTINYDIKLDLIVDGLDPEVELTDEQKIEFNTKIQDPNYRNEIENTIEKLRDLGISCFSKQRANLLMWAHYADKNHGIVLKFDTFKDVDFFSSSFPINYVNKYCYDYDILVNLRKYHFLNETGASLTQFFAGIKSDEWRYEDEVRVMKQDSGFYPIHKEAITEVIFGCQALDDDMANFVKIAKDNGWDHLKFTSTSKKDWNFGLDFSDYKTI